MLHLPSLRLITCLAERLATGWLFYMLTLKDPIQSKSQQRMRAGNLMVAHKSIRESVIMWQEDPDLCSLSRCGALLSANLSFFLLQASQNINEKTTKAAPFVNISDGYMLWILSLVSTSITWLMLSAALCQMYAVWKPAVMNSWECSVFPCPSINTDRSENSLSVWLVAGSSSVYFYKAIKNTM